MTSRLPRQYAAALALLVIGLVLAGCGGSSGHEPTDATHPRATDSAHPRATPEPARPAGKRVYVAVGASETVGVGADRPRQAWPTVLHRQALPESRYVNVGVSGST